MAKVLITGASGFVGSNMADELYANGYNVICFDKDDSRYYKGRERERFIKGDLLDVQLLNKIMHGVDYVFHFGGIADIDIANKMPHSALNINIMGTVNLIEACLKNDVKRFMFASTVYVHSKMGGFYAASKKACENIIENYGSTYNLNYTILRYGSLYGHRCGKNNSIYKIIKGILENNIFLYNGTGEEIREFINILDASKISIKCLDEKYKNESLILTGSEKMRIKDLIEMIKEIAQKDTKIEYLGEQNPLHYTITPYNYTPTLGKKIVNNPYIDIGQGILEMIKSIKGASNYNIPE